MSTEKVIYVDTDKGVKALDKDNKRLYDVEPNGDFKTYTDEKGVKRYASDDVEVHEAVTFDPEQMAKAQHELEAMQERNNAANSIYDWQRIYTLAGEYNTTTEVVKEALRHELGQNERNVMADLGHANADRIYSTEIGLTDPNLPGSGYMTWVFGKKDNTSNDSNVPAKAEPKYGINIGSLKPDRNNGIKNNTQNIDTGNIIDDKTAAAAYAYNIRKGEINHIFHNDFYSYDPVPAWSFSVDFIPCAVDDHLSVQMFPIEKTMTLTKAVQKITANDKTINVQQLNYLGMQHPFFTKMQATHGDLKITFAEDEYFTITNILKDVLKYASFDPSFCTNKVYSMYQDTFEESVVEYAPSDNMAPQYRQNATDMSVDDPNIAKLVHNHKFVFDIVLKLYKAEHAHIFNDDIMPPGFVYHYHKCWLKSIDSIDLDYDNDSMIDRNAVFSYQYMSSVPYSTYVQRYKTSDNDIVLDEVTVKASNIFEQETPTKPEFDVHKAQLEQIKQNAADQARAEGSNNNQATAAAIAGEMHKYRR